MRPLAPISDLVFSDALCVVVAANWEKESSGHVEWTTQSGCRNNNSYSKSVMAVQVGDVFHAAACCKG